jgi:hypothetical protein
VKKLPKFGGIFKAPKEFAIPDGSVTFKLKERTERVNNISLF